MVKRCRCGSAATSYSFHSCMIGILTSVSRLEQSKWETTVASVCFRTRLLDVKQVRLIVPVETARHGTTQPREPSIRPSFAIRWCWWLIDWLVGGVFLWTTGRGKNVPNPKNTQDNRKKKNKQFDNEKLLLAGNETVRRRKIWTIGFTRLNNKLDVKLTINWLSTGPTTLIFYFPQQACLLAVSRWFCYCCSCSWGECATQQHIRKQCWSSHVIVRSSKRISLKHTQTPTHIFCQNLGEKYPCFRLIFV